MATERNMTRRLCKKFSQFNQGKVILTLSAPKLLLGLILGLVSASAMADQFYMMAGFECKANEAKLAVWFRGYENEKGDRAVSHLGENNFDPRALVIFVQNPDGKYTIQSKTVTRTCALGQENYSIEISPLMAHKFHPEGACAARIGISVTVKKNNKILVTEGFDACTDFGEVTTDFVVSPGRKTTYKKITARDFLSQR